MKNKGIKKAITPLLIFSCIGLFQYPATINAAVQTQAYEWKNVKINGGGYVDNIIFNPGEKDLIYARTDMGGAYRYDTANQSWDPLTDWIGWDDWNNLGCESLAVDPVETNRVYIAAGTYTNDWTSDNGYILRSEDYGETWEQTELPFKNGANMLGRSMGERLIVDPNSNNVLYFGARSGKGLWKSVDYGETWNQVSSLTHVGNYAPIEDDSTTYDNTLTGVVWVTPDPSSSTKGTPCQTVYIGVANKKGEDMVYRTLDGGATWSAVEGQPHNIVVPDPEKNPAKTTGLFPHHGVLASNGILYIPYSDGTGPYDGHKGEIWKYDTKSEVWTDITPIPTSSGDNYFGFGGLAVDANNPDTLIVSTLNSWWPDANFFRSTDGGNTWVRFWDWNGYPSRTLRYSLDISESPWLTFGKYENPPEPVVKLGWMIGNISIDPFNSDRMMYGTGATVYGTNNLTDIDTGGTVKLSVVAKGIEQTAAQTLVSPATGTAHLISGMYDLGGFVHNDLDKVPSMMMLTPFLANTSIDYAELSPTRFVRVGKVDTGSGSRIGLSYDTGNNWFSLNNPWQSGDSDTTEGGNVAMSADGNSIVWAPKGKPVYYSTNTGSSFSQSSGIPAGAMVASDRVNSDKFYGFYNGKFYVSTDKGATFTAKVTTGLPDSAMIKAMPGVEGDVWLAGASGKSGLFHTTNSGESFVKITGVEEASTIGFGKAAPGQTYMALYTSAFIDGIRGIFRSDDGGANWIRINDNDHQYGMTNACITGDPRIYGRVYLATNGRGILYADIKEDLPDSSSIAPVTASFDKNTKQQEDIAVSLELNGNTFHSITQNGVTLNKDTDYTINDATVTIKKDYLSRQPAGSLALDFNFSAGASRTLTITVTDTTGTQNSVITPDTAEFDKNSDNSKDIRVSMKPNGNSLLAIKNGSYTLTEGTDYSVTDQTIVIKKEYLSQQSIGTASLTFDFSAGTDPVMTILIKNSTVIEEGNLKVEFIGPTAAQTNTIAGKYRLTNTGDSAIPLSDLKLRYYYTADSSQPQNFFCDWSHAGSQNIAGSFHALDPALETADTYLEIGFLSEAGSLAPGQSIELHTRVSKSDWSNYIMINDYSYTPAASYEVWDKITAYQNDTLIFGIEPQ
ncbi:X2-like carbohydrate binding domain-containing protein [Clostridium sp. Marseille-P2415]|uniref:X2-like carbohydrate binding domain-containing protein n=1 Tax=Clostridium sp. Marseille-P2415 TaxID=1805471 RepID=UPI0009883FF6|nr:X2-like carbohydrate binding domain-containing protein [Clostridium sp. Marseille-P2415]